MKTVDEYLKQIKSESFGGSRKPQSALRDYFKEEQIDWVTPPTNHPLSGKTEKKESR